MVVVALVARSIRLIQQLDLNSVPNHRHARENDLVDRQLGHLDEIHDPWLQGRLG